VVLLFVTFLSSSLDFIVSLATSFTTLIESFFISATLFVFHRLFSKSLSCCSIFSCSIP
jgi:hypothetical protein